MGDPSASQAGYVPWNAQSFVVSPAASSLVNVPRKVVLKVRRNNEEKFISFFPDSPFTTAETLQALFVSCFGLDAHSRFYLIDDEDQSPVPFDKSIAFLKCVRLVEITQSRLSSLTTDDTHDEAHHEALKLARLLDIFSCISAEAQPEKAVHTIVEKSRDVLCADHVVLYIVDAEARILVVAASSDEDVLREEEFDEFKMVERISLDNPNSLAVDAAKTGEITYSNTTLCAPVKESGGLTLGVIEASRDSNKLAAFDQDSMHALEFIATCTGSVLHRLQLWYHSTRAEDRAQALLKVTKTLAAAKKPEEIVTLVVKEAYELLHAERVAVFLVHAQEKELEICLSKDASGTRIPMTSGLAGYVARTGESVNVADVRQDPRFNSATDSLTGFRTKAVLCCPISDASGRVIGVIQALNKMTASLTPGKPIGSDDNVESFTDDDRELLEMLTQSAGVTLQNAQLLQAAEHARITTRALLRLVQQVVGEPDFLKLDNLLRSCCKQLLDCERCIVAWISRTDSTLRIFLEEGEMVSVDLADGESIEAQAYKQSGLFNCPYLGDNPKLFCRYDERTKYKTESFLAAPIGGGIQGPLAIIIALNKLEPESSLSVPLSSNSSSPKPLSRAYKPFSKEDEMDMMLFSSEVEGALRVKRNLQMDFTNLLFEADEKEDINTDEKTPEKKVDPQQRRLMMLYSGRDLSMSNAKPEKREQKDYTGAASPSASQLKKNGNSEEPGLVDEGEWTDDENFVTSPRTESKIETKSMELVRTMLSDVLNVDVLGQTSETLKSWTLSLFFSDISTLRQVGVDVRKFPRFVSEVHDNYHPNSFHNFGHAFSVFHTAHDIVKRTVEGRKIESICALSILLASLCHDLGHKGMTNSYESATMSDLAIRYSDEAILERYHSYVAFRLLYQDSRSNILATMSHNDMSVLRKYIIEGILATDMRRHAEHVSELERLILDRRRTLFRSGSFHEHDFLKTPTTRSRRTSLDNTAPTPIHQAAHQAAAAVPPSPKVVAHHHRRSSSYVGPSSDTEVKRSVSPQAVEAFFSKPEGKSLLVRSIVHAADLSSQTFKIEYAEDWGRRITAEFSAQAELERTMGLPISVPVCHTEVEFFKSQVFFICQIVLPLWRGLAEFLPELNKRVDALEHNVNHYEARAKKAAQLEKDKPAHSPIAPTIASQMSPLELDGEKEGKE